MAGKIRKAEGQKLSEFEEKVATEIAALVNAPSNEEIKPILEELWFSGAKQIKVGKKEAILLTLPYRLLSKYRTVQVRLVRELEKKFSSNHVVVIAKRTIVPEKSRSVKRAAGQRPRTRTLTAVQDAQLEDIVAPGEIVGKRLRVTADGKKALKVFLDPKDKTQLEGKFETFEAVYQKLTGKQAKFEFPVEA